MRLVELTAQDQVAVSITLGDGKLVCDAQPVAAYDVIVTEAPPLAAEEEEEAIE